MASYKEIEKELKKLHTENEIIFRCGISHLLDVGSRHLTTEIVERTCAEIMQQDDSRSLMTNEFQCAIVRMAGKLAEIPDTMLLHYISKNVKYSVF